MESLFHRYLKMALHRVLQLAPDLQDEAYKVAVAVSSLTSPTSRGVRGGSGPGGRGDPGAARGGRVVGDTKANSQLVIKRLALHKKSKVKVEFRTHSESGTNAYTLCFMCKPIWDTIRSTPSWLTSKRMVNERTT